MTNQGSARPARLRLLSSQIHVNHVNHSPGTMVPPPASEFLSPPLLGMRVASCFGSPVSPRKTWCHSPLFFLLAGVGSHEWPSPSRRQMRPRPSRPDDPMPSPLSPHHHHQQQKRHQKDILEFTSEGPVYLDSPSPSLASLQRQCLKCRPPDSELPTSPTRWCTSLIFRLPIS